MVTPGGLPAAIATAPLTDILIPGEEITCVVDSVQNTQSVQGDWTVRVGVGLRPATAATWEELFELGAKEVAEGEDAELDGPLGFLRDLCSRLM